MIPQHRLALVLALAALATERGAAAAPDAAAVARGERLVRQGECGRCHDTSGLPGAIPVPRAQSCAGCHAWIHASASDPESYRHGTELYPLWDQYVRNVRLYLAVPHLAAAGARLDPAWVSRFLRAPYKIRPGFREAMIRTPLSSSEADDVAAFLHAQARPLDGEAARAAAVPLSNSPADIAAGERLYDQLRCQTCHAFGQRAATPGIAEAPDLRHTRARMSPGTIAALIADPTLNGTHTGSRMPHYPLAVDQIARLRDFIVGAPVTTAAPGARTPDLPLLARRVTWAEVNQRVLAALCAHCHSDGQQTDGDGGPGNTGGLGFRGAGLDLGSWRGVQRGARRAGGRRVSVLVPGPGDNEPPLIARLRRRMTEHAGELAGLPESLTPDQVAGMPLGLPPLDAERFALLRSWIAQGAPGPRASPAP